MNMQQVKLSFDGKVCLMSGIALLIVGSSLLGLQFFKLATNELFPVAMAGLSAIVGIIFIMIPAYQLSDSESFKKGKQSVFINVTGY